MIRHSRYWTTGLLYVASFVFAKGAELVDVRAAHGNVVFVFARTFACQAAIAEFERGKPLIDARLYAYALGQLQQQAEDALLECHGQA